MKIKKIFYFCFSPLLLALVLNFSIGTIFFKKNTALALEMTYPTILGLSITEQSSFPDYAAYFFNIGMTLAVSLAALVITIGGIIWIVSFGRGKTQQSAKDWVKSGIMGLILLMASYVIVYTINPDLIVFGKQILRALNINPADKGQTETKPVPESTYNEIPIGTLMENLLTRQINCYDFDAYGEPIDGDPKTPDIIEPSLKDHDRLDCIVKLAEAVVKKAKISSDLSEQIARLMDTCKCIEDGTPAADPCAGVECPKGLVCDPSYGKCNNPKNINPEKKTSVGTTPVGGACENPSDCASNKCVNNICAEAAQGTTGGTPTKPGGKCKLKCNESKCPESWSGPCPGGYCNSDCSDAGCISAQNLDNESCCSSDTKEKIEHGPIKMSASNCAPPQTPPQTSPQTPPQTPLQTSQNTSGSKPISSSFPNIYTLGNIIPSNFLAANNTETKNATISISPTSSTIKMGGSQQYSVVGRDKDGNNIGGILSGEGCKGDTCTPSSPGTFEITARLASDPSIFATATLVVTPPLQVSCYGPGQAVIGGTQNLVASASGGNGNYSYSWSGANCANGTSSSYCATSFAKTGYETITVNVVSGDEQKSCVVKLSVNTVLLASCSASKNPADIDEKIELTAVPGGGRPPYTYKWELPKGASKCKEGAEKSTCSTSFSKKGTYNISVAITFSGNWFPNYGNCTVTVGEGLPEEGAEEKEYAGLDEFRGQYVDGLYVANKVEKESKDHVIVIDKAAWDKIRIVDKIKYFKEKIKLLGLEKDLENLTRAKYEINGCYSVMSYVDYLRLVTQTDKKDKIISSQMNYEDPVYKNPISIARYCKGYEYQDAQCFQVCQKNCGPLNEDSFNILKNCPACQYDDPSYNNCLNEQKICAQNAINSARCSSKDAGSTFQECMNNCNKKCVDDCQQKYALCPEDLKNCQNNCNNDSKLLITNEDKCYFNFNTLQKCATLKYCTDTNNICSTNDGCDTERGEKCEEVKYQDFADCAANSYLCKYASDQQPGGENCLKTKGKDFSSYWLYKNPTAMLSPTCHVTTDPETKNLISTGVEQYPKYQACPVCSNCPQCPIIDNKIIESLLTPTGQCNEFSYNDDPLTFYCRQNWEPGQSLAGKGWVCPASDEIPIGQTVDDAEIWAKAIIKAINDFDRKIDGIIYNMIQIASEKGYCQCNSACGVNGFGVLEKNCGGDCVPFEINIPPSEGGGENGGGGKNIDGGGDEGNINGGGGGEIPADTTGEGE